MSNMNRKKNHQPVKVYIRQRPFSDYELSLNCLNVVEHLTNTEIVIRFGLSERKYGFDGVFGEDTSQKEIYEVVVSPLIKCMISGYNCTVFAYGQTGTGKTYTMVGIQPFEGLIPRAAAHLFEELDQLDTKIEYTVRVSFIEIYNEEVNDLLVNTNTPLKIFDDPDNKGSVCIKGMKEATVFNLQEVYDWLNAGLAERQTASTNMNRQSSRSHSIFTLSVATRQLTVDGDELIKIGKLHMVDLAGSENVGKSGSTEMRAREAGNINKSLLTLGKVIKALALKAQHVPYRDSKLTRILQDSLGGKTKTCMIATVSAASIVWDETVSTLDYAQVARNVSNCPQVNENRKQANLLKNLKEEISRLRKELAIARSGDGFYMSRENYEKLCDDLDDLKRRNEELETESCNVRQELEEKDRQLKRDEYVVNYLEHRENELRSAAEQLRKVCEVSAKHEALFCQKYEKQCAVSFKNAATAQNAYSLFGNSVTLLQNATKDHSKYSSLDEVHANVACLRDNAWKMCKRLSEYSRKIKDSEDEGGTKLNEETVCRDFEKETYLSLEHIFEEQKRKVEELEKYNEAKVQEMEMMTTRCVNSMKQLLNDYMMCVNDVMKAQSSLIQSVKNSTINDEIALNETVRDHRLKGVSFVQNLVADVNDKFNLETNKAKELKNRYSKEIEGMKAEFTTESESKVDNIVRSLKSAEDRRKQYEKSFENFADQTLARIRRELDENVQFVTHVGDTPVQQNYIYPRQIEEKLPRTVLYQQFENSHC